jgi:hypothetical protein
MMEALPAADPNLNPDEPCGVDEECTNEDYTGWWAQGKKLYDYLSRMPPAYADELGMGTKYRQLLARWKREVKKPSALPEIVDESTLGTLLLWMRHAETLIYYVTYEDQGNPVPGPTTPGRLEVVAELPTEPHHWPWIEGWDDTRMREKILNPKKPARFSGKTVLLIGAGVAGAVYLGKKFFSE